MSLISIIIPSLNSPIIDTVVKAVLQQIGDYDVEIVIVGRDEAQRIPSSPLVRFIDTGVAVGPAAARNLGIVHSNGDLLCFLDADCVPQAGWLDRLVAAQKAGHQVVSGGVGIAVQGYWSLCDDLLVFGPLLPWSEPGPRHTLPSLNLSINRATLRAVGGFDERFFPAGEDIELSYRLRKAGCTLFCEPRAIVMHCHSRRAMRDVWRHLFVFGATQVPLAEQHPEIGASSARRIAARFPRIFLLAAPLLATLDVVRFFVQCTIPQRYIYAVPGLIVVKSAWYIGFAMALRGSVARTIPALQ